MPLVGSNMEVTIMVRLKVRSISRLLCWRNRMRRPCLYKAFNAPT
jgi:hypothetical protein